MFLTRVVSELYISYAHWDDHANKVWQTDWLTKGYSSTPIFCYKKETLLLNISVSPPPRGSIDSMSWLAENLMHNYDGSLVHRAITEYE